LSATSSLPVPKEPTRLERRGYQPKTARKPIVELTPEQRLFLEYQLVGCAKPDLCAQIGVRLHEPLSVEQAADLVRIRRRFARWLTQQPAYRREWSKGVQAIRDGQAVAAVRTQIELMNDPGDGSAAAGTLRLKASQSLLGDSEGRSSASVNIAVNTAINLQPGLVIRIKDDLPETPLEAQARERGDIIDATPIEQHDAPEGYAMDPQAEADMARRWPVTIGDDQ
jgi:hypothetical protein